MSDAVPGALRAERERLVARLAGPLDAPARAEVRQEIIALFRRTEEALAEVEAFRESIRELVERFKALPAIPPPDAGRSVRHDHLGASTVLERGWSALAGGDYAGAEALLREALARDATSGAAQALLGWALLHQGRGDEALQLCLQVLLREPEHGMARTAVGVICLRKGIVGEAIEHLARAIRTAADPRAVLYANYWLGAAYLQREMPADAAEFLRRAVTLGPNLAEGWTALGEALWWQGDRAGAREAWATGAGIRHSPHAARAATLLARADGGGEIPRFTLP